MGHLPIYAVDAKEGDLPAWSKPCADCGKMQGWWDNYIGQMNLDGEWVALCDGCHDKRFPIEGEIWQYGRCISHPEKTPAEQLRLFE